MIVHTTYHPESQDRLRRIYSLADVQEFVAGIAAENEGVDPADVMLKIEGGLAAELVRNVFS